MASSPHFWTHDRSTEKAHQEDSISDVYNGKWSQECCIVTDFHFLAFNERSVSEVLKLKIAGWPFIVMCAAAIANNFNKLLGNFRRFSLL